MIYLPKTSTFTYKLVVVPARIDTLLPLGIRAPRIDSLNMYSDTHATAIRNGGDRSVRVYTPPLIETVVFQSDVNDAGFN